MERTCFFVVPLEMPDHLSVRIGIASRLPVASRHGADSVNAPPTPSSAARPTPCCWCGRRCCRRSGMECTWKGACLAGALWSTSALATRNGGGVDRRRHVPSLASSHHLHRLLAQVKELPSWRQTSQGSSHRRGLREDAGGHDGHSKKECLARTLCPPASNRREHFAAIPSGGAHVEECVEHAGKRTTTRASGNYPTFQ